MKTNIKTFWLNFFALTFVMLAVSAVAFIVMYDDGAKKNEQEETASLAPSGYIDNTDASTTIPTVTVILPSTTQSDNFGEIADTTESEKVSETQNTSESLSASENQSETADTTEAQTTTEKPTTTEAPTTTEEPTTPEPATSEEPTVAPTTTPEPETTTKTPAIDSTKDTTESPTTVAEGTTLTTVTVEPSYFDDALFIGDSRTVGIQLYGVLTGADFFCNTGMSIYSLRKANIEIDGVGKIGISDLLKTKTYGKVYVMLGINEISYSFNGTVKKYKALLDEIRETQPNADIYIQANLHVTKERSDKDQYVNNPNLDKFNNAIAQFADNKTIFYIDPNEYFDDAEGNLSTEYCSDASHIRTKYYKEWSKWICTKVFVTE